MKSMMRFLMAAVVVSLISGAAYAKKDNDVKKADKEKQKITDAASKQKNNAEKEAKEAKNKADKKAKKANKEAESKVKDANEPKKGFAWGKDHKQQLKALDEKAARVDAKNKEKVAALEKELADAKAANYADKAAKLEKKLAQTKEKVEAEIKKIDAKRAEIKAAAEK